MRDDLKGEQVITQEHTKNNLDVRNLSTEKNIYPESLPPAEDIKKIGRKIIKDQDKLLLTK